MNNYLKVLDPVVTKLGLDECDNIKFLQGPCQKVNVAPKYVVSLLLLVSLTMIVIGVASGFISTLIGVLYPAYKSIQAMESKDSSDDDKQWLTYWIVFSITSTIDANFGFLLSFVPFYHLIKLLFFASLFHPQFRGAELVYTKVSNIYKQLIHPQYEKYHSEIDQKLAEIQKKATEAVADKIKGQ